MRVARKLQAFRSLGTNNQCIAQVENGRANLGDPAARIEAQSGRDLIIAAPCGVEPCTRFARKLCHPALDRGVDVFVTFGEEKGPVFELFSHRRERVEQGFDIVGTEDPSTTKASDVSLRTRDVLETKLLVE